MYYVEVDADTQENILSLDGLSEAEARAFLSDYEECSAYAVYTNLPGYVRPTSN